jgi:hypothetical protein
VTDPTPTFDWTQRSIDRHVEQVAAGLHDGSCEWRRDRFLCHCEKRARIARGLTDLPVLSIQYPICLGCDESVDMEDGQFYCPRCHALWGQHATDGDRAIAWTDDYGDLS